MNGIRNVSVFRGHELANAPFYEDQNVPFLSKGTGISFKKNAVSTNWKYDFQILNIWKMFIFYLFGSKWNANQAHIMWCKFAINVELYLFYSLSLLSALSWHNCSNCIEIINNVLKNVFRKKRFSAQHVTCITYVISRSNFKDVPCVYLYFIFTYFSLVNKIEREIYLFLR